MIGFAASALCLVAALTPSVASADGFLSSRSHVSGHSSSSQEEFQAALASVLGCGADANSNAVRFDQVRTVLEPMWRVVPKNKYGKVEWSMVRYLAHRYFMQQSSLLVRGFEPIKQINVSYIGAPEILGDHAPLLFDGGRHTLEGFSMEDVVAMIATLEQLITDSEHSVLDTVYKQALLSPKAKLTHADLSSVLESYMVHWMVDEEDYVVKALVRNRTLREQALPKWSEITGYVEGIAQEVLFERQSLMQPGFGSFAMESRFALPDAQEVVSRVTKGFASFWESECQVIKESLVALDQTGTGRVSLSEFYGANADGEWRFGESEAYLRELGALDESVPSRGKQVIIPNYLQGASNCIVATSNYLVCCVNECEATLNSLEDSVGAPFAEPTQILDHVANMTDLDDNPPKVDAALRTQLLRIAEIHGGHVPLHGRLFAQWLHYVFPRECPFPHKAGTASALTPVQYGDGFIASSEEVNNHAAARNETSTLMGDLEEAQWMSQWSEEEELIGDYSTTFQAPWQRQARGFGFAFGSVAAAAVAVLAGYAAKAVSADTDAKVATTGEAAFDAFSKAHYV